MQRMCTNSMLGAPKTGPRADSIKSLLGKGYGAMSLHKQTQQVFVHTFLQCIMPHVWIWAC